MDFEKEFFSLENGFLSIVFLMVVFFFQCVFSKVFGSGFFFKKVFFF